MDVTSRIPFPIISSLLTQRSEITTLRNILMEKQAQMGHTLLQILTELGYDPTTHSLVFNEDSMVVEVMPVKECLLRSTIPIWNRGGN